MSFDLLRIASACALITSLGCSKAKLADNSNAAGAAGESGQGGASARDGSSGTGGSAGTHDNAGGTTAGITGSQTGGSGGAAGAVDAGAGGVDGMASDASGSDDAGEIEAPDESCLTEITDLRSEGPFSNTMMSFDDVKLWIPEVPAGCKVPVIHLAVGTGGACEGYEEILSHLASHGFVAACAEAPSNLDGKACMSALELAMTEYPDLISNKLGSTGHAQGGGAGIFCVHWAEEKWGDAVRIAGHAIEPSSGTGAGYDWEMAYGAIRSPMFLFNGSADNLVPESWVKQGFDALDPSVEAYWYEASGAPHIPIPATWAKESALLWFRWKLLDDSAACELFKALPSGNEWDLQAERNAATCE